MLKRTCSALLFLCALVLPVTVVCAAEEIPNEKAAILAALDTLQLIDNQEYEKSWETFAPLFRERADKQEWLKDFPHMRGNYGALISRHVQFVKRVDPPRGAPKTEYLFILFASSFKVKSAAETVTMMLQPDGRWQVAGYHIK